MEKKIEKLWKSIESRDFGDVFLILKGFLENWAEFIQVSKKYSVRRIVRALETVIELGKVDREVDVAMEILVKLTTVEREAFEIFLKYFDYLHLLDMDDHRARVRDCMCILAISNMEKHFSWKEVKALPSEVLWKLIGHPNDRGRSLAVILLLKIAREVGEQIFEKVPKDMLNNAFLKEKRSAIREDILEIQKIVNPFGKSSDYITLDTLFLVNWIRMKDDIPYSEIDELLDSMQKTYLHRPRLLSYITNLMVASRRPDILTLPFVRTERIREHDVHQFNVGVMGLFLLENHVLPSKTLRDYIADLKGWEPECVNKAWLVTAFLHDHARPIEIVLRKAHINYELKTRTSDFRKHVEEDLERQKVVENLLSRDLYKIYSRAISSGVPVRPALENLVFSELRKVQCHKRVKPNEIFDHGVLAAINLAPALAHARAHAYADEEIITTSIKAIAVHHLASEKIKLIEEPVAFLLVLCDEIQEWGREFAQRTPTVKIGKFTSEDGRLFFEDKLEVLFEYPSELCVRARKDYVRRRLDFSDCNIKPNDVSFQNCS